MISNVGIRAAAAGMMLLGLAATRIPHQWQYSETRDRMTDRIYARSSANGVGGMLVVKCDAPGKDSLYLQFLSDTPLGYGSAADDRDFEWRFDHADAQLAQWRYHGGGAISDDPLVVGSFLRGLLKARQLTIRTHSYQGTEADTIIDVTGAAEAVHHVAHTCQATIPDNER